MDPLNYFSFQPVLHDSFRLAARVLLYTPSHRQDITYYGLCYTSRGALAGTRNRDVTAGTDLEGVEVQGTHTPTPHPTLKFEKCSFYLGFLCFSQIYLVFIIITIIIVVVVVVIIIFKNTTSAVNHTCRLKLRNE